MSIARTQILSALDKVHRDLAVAEDHAAAFFVGVTRDIIAARPKDTPLLLASLAEKLRDTFDAFPAANTIELLVVPASLVEIDNCVRDLAPFMKGAADGQS